MPTVVRKPAFAEITLQNGEKFQVVETFATVLRHQKDALVKEDEPLIDLMGPDGKRVAVDPVEIISVSELQRPTRNFGRRDGGTKRAKPKAAAKKKTGTRLAQRRETKKTTTKRTRRRRVAA